MPAVVLALASAALYGLSDFLGGVVSRRVPVWQVAVVTQLAALVAIGLAAMLLPADPRPQDLAWGAVAGVGTGAGTAFLYRGLSGGRMGIVAPLSAVGAALLPVIVGIVTGERPPLLAWIGIGLALPAIWLVSSAADPVDVGGAPHPLGEGVVDGLLAGVGFGVMFAALGQVPEAAGLQPLAVAELTSIPSVIGLALLMGQRWLPRDRGSWNGIVIGGLAAGASVLFLFATQSGLLAIASVLSSLYPAFTVLLAATILRERIHVGQGIGLVLAVGAVALVAAG